jgi:hypothetical protein
LIGLKAALKKDYALGELAKISLMLVFNHYFYINIVLSPFWPIYFIGFESALISPVWYPKTLMSWSRQSILWGISYLEVLVTPSNDGVFLAC